MSTMFYPLITFVLLFICIAYWAMIALYPLCTQPALLGLWGQRAERAVAAQCLSAMGGRLPFLWADTAPSQDRAGRGRSG